MFLLYAKCLGTHIDAPRHILEDLNVMRGLAEFSEVRLRSNKVHDLLSAFHQLPLSAFIGEACVFDVTDKHKDYLISVEDVRKWEEEHGRLHERRAW